MNFIQDNCQRFSLHFKSTFHRLFQVYCITQKMHISQELAFLWITIFSVMRHNSSVLFHLKFYMLWIKRSSSKCKFSDFWVLSWKFTQFFMPFLKLQGESLFKFCIAVQCLWNITPMYFCSSNFAYFGQKEDIEKKLSDFSVVGWKFTEFLMSYLKPQVSFSLNFVSFFSFMRDNYSVLLELKLYMIWTKETHPRAKL